MAALPPWLDRVGRRPLYALIALVAAAAMLWSFRPRAVTVELARFERGDVTVEFVEEGRTRLRERFVLGGQCDGRRLAARDIERKAGAGQNPVFRRRRSLGKNLGHKAVGALLDAFGAGDQRGAGAQ